jgi:hypothetical protein
MPVLTAAKGLKSQANALTRPDGALTKADNIVVDFDNTIQRRRGFKEYNSSAFNDSPKAIFTYRSRILTHYENTLAYDSDGAGVFADFNGDYEQLISGLRLKSVEANGNFYFTSSTGIKKISAKDASELNSSSITEAGGIKAIDLSGSVVPDSSGFLPAQSKVSYRILFGTKDSNNNLIPGSPSSRLVLSNNSADVSQSEIFTINVLDYTSVASGDYFLFDLSDGGYFVYFDKTGTTAAPVNSDTLDREGIKVTTSGTPTNSEAAAAIANVLATITGIEIELSSTEIEVTITNPGDVSDAAQGSLLASEILITKVIDGSVITGSPAYTSLTSILPSSITTDYFYQLYRTAVITVQTGQTMNDIEPGDENYYILEAPITSTDISNGFITIEDNTPEIFRESGAYLYTNSITGTGIISANERPPVAHDIANFRNSTFYANTKDVHRHSFSILSVDDFVSGTTALTIGKGVSTNTYTFRGVAEAFDVTVKKKTETVGNSYITMSSANNERNYYVWFDKGIIAHTIDSTNDVDDGVLNFIQVASGHGFATNDEVTFSGTTPGGITAGTTYYIVSKNSTDFAVSLTPNGPEVDITSQVVGTCVVTHVPEDPAISGKIGVRIPLELYEDTVDESKLALITALTFTGDFDPVDFSTDVVRVTNVDSGASTDPALSSTAPGWTVAIVTQGLGEDASNSFVLLSQNTSVAISIDLTARSLVRVINSDATCPVFAQYLSGADDLPGKILLEAKSGEDVDFYIQINDSSLSAEFSPEISSIADTTVSDNNEGPNRIYFSKTLQPEAVPINQYIDVGSKDRPILRILPLRDNLFVLKEDGIYTVTGDVAPNFSVRLIDNSAILIAPDTAVVLNNLIYCLTTQGVVTISETGVSIVSRDIEDLIKQVTTFAYNFKYTSFGVAYESDRAYLLWLPTLKSDTIATQCYRYNTITNTWTRWILTSTCGIVKSDDDRLYIGKGDRDYIAQERKDGGREDYADRDFARTIGIDSVTETTIKLSSTVDVEEGDAITQSLYVTPVKFNRLLKKLTDDPGATDTDYFTTLEVVRGDNLATKLSQLITKLNADATLGTFTASSGSNDFGVLKDDYNILINELNSPSSGTVYKTYSTAVDLIVNETLIQEVDSANNTVTVDFVGWFVQGEVTVFKTIECEVQWAPQHFGSPQTLKQITEGTLIFEKGTIYSATIGYSSDRSAAFTDIDFELQGPGFWGGFDWANIVFGGAGDGVPKRTLIPIQHSRCRYLNVRFKHKNAREQFKLLGISLEPREIGPRAYR